MGARRARRLMRTPTHPWQQARRQWRQAPNIELNPWSTPLAVAVYPAHPLPSALQLHASAEGNANNPGTGACDGKCQPAIPEPAPTYHPLRQHAALAEGCEECIPLAAAALSLYRRVSALPRHLTWVVVPAPTTTTTADTTMRRSRTATTAAGNGSENGTGGEHDNGHDDAPDGHVSTPDDGRHQPDNTTTAGRNHAADEHGGWGTVHASTSGYGEGGGDEAKHGHGNEGHAECGRVKRTHGYGETDASTHGAWVRARHAHDLPFLDDPDNSDEHSVEAMSGGEQQ
ncbi:hypothetical protein BJ912DRAFT_921896 [Pholiota molesta]|nr:hypothetical protein BJ912DRAFT_921896 [Pholiota molesta]